MGRHTGRSSYLKDGDSVAYSVRNTTTAKIRRIRQKCDSEWTVQILVATVQHNIPSFSSEFL